MSRWMHRITPMALCLFMAFGAQAQSLESQNETKPINTQTDKALSDSQFVQSGQESLTRRMAISERASQVLTLLASELVWNQGQTGTALATHEMILQKSQDPAVAERAMEMALNMNAISQAKSILQQWQTLQPAETPAKLRLSWQLALAENDIAFVAKHIDTVLTQANDFQLRHLFLLLAQATVAQKQWPNSVYASIHQTAQKHQDLPEAVIADAISSAHGKRDMEAVSALQKLAQLDGSLQPVSQLTIKLIGALRPQVLATFFQSESFNNLPSAWQSVYIDWLVTNKKLDEAYQLLQPILNRSHNADLYLQAIFLSVNQKAPIETILAYADQAYALGSDVQKSKTATMLSIYMTEHNRNEEARAWAKKIVAPQFAFDRTVLMATIDQQDQHWRAAQNWLDQAEKFKKPGQFFDQNNLFRLQVVQANETLTPAQYLNKLNLWLNRAKKQNNNAMTAQLILMRGMAYVDKLHQPEKAVADFRHYLTLRPNDVEGLNSLGYTLLSLPKQHWQEAQSLLEQAYKLDSQSAYINDSLGWAYYLNGRAADALPLLQYAYAQFPNAEVAAHLGAVLWESGRQDEARQIWAQGRASKDDQQVLTRILKQFKVDPTKLPKILPEPVKKPAFTQDDKE